MEIASLIVGLSAVVLYLLCFQLKSVKKIIACKLLSSILYVLQYLLIFAFVGAAMDAAAVIASVIAYQKDTKFVRKYKIPLILITNAGIIAFGLLLYQNIISLLPVAGVLFESAANWMENEKRLRIVSLFAVPCWLIYNVVSKAYSSAVGSVLALISILTALIRYSNLEKSNRKLEKEIS